MLQLQDKKSVKRLMILFTVTYMCSYITRINYGAIISEMISATGAPKNQISMALTGSFISYGAGQIISGICGDRFSPKRLVTAGLLVTSVMNFALPFFKNPYFMLVIWCVNGFAQAFIWPPMVRIMSALLTREDYNNVTAKVQWGGSLGTIAVYFAGPALISAFNWKSVFYFSAACGLVMAFIWNKFSYDVAKEQSERGGPDDLERKSMRIFFTPFVIGVMGAIVLQGALRDGITTWTPSYVSETFNIGNNVAILTGVTLPLFGIVCFQIASKLHEKLFKNPVACAGVIFGAGSLAAVGLFFFSSENAVLSVALSAVFTGCMHGVNLMLTCILPPYFRAYGNVSTAAGILNCCTYIGSAASTYGIAVISDSFGWRSTFLVWLLTAVAGTAICFVCARPWRKILSE